MVSAAELMHPDRYQVHGVLCTSSVASPRLAVTNAAYKQVAYRGRSGNAVILAFWAHWRRRFYGLKVGLERFLEDGRIEIDTNVVERSMRPIALNRKNALFAGHDIMPRTEPASPG